MEAPIKTCMSCMKRPAITKIGVRHLCKSCKDSRDAAIKKAVKK